MIVVGDEEGDEMVDDDNSDSNRSSEDEISNEHYVDDESESEGVEDIKHSKIKKSKRAKIGQSMGVGSDSESDESVEVSLKQQEELALSLLGKRRAR